MGAFSVVRRQTFVIVGGGQAGAQAAATLREYGYKGRIVVLCAEPHPPYARPPLSKSWLAGDAADDRLPFRPADAYAQLDIELKLGMQVEWLDPKASRLRLQNGLGLEYDALLFATGAEPRKLSVPGSTGPDIHLLRDWNDARRLAQALGHDKRLLVIGGGYLGLEVASTARAAGCRVRIVEREPRVLSRVTSSVVSEFFARVHRDAHVDVRCETQVLGFEGTDRLEAVDTAGGRIDADVALVAVGVRPRDRLARDAGLSCEDGIIVDSRCRTSVPNIFAAGDCARFPEPMSGQLIRLESVQNAVDQAEVAARNMLGADQPYRKVPWFWSQQYGFKLQTAGLVAGHDASEVRGDPASGRFAVRYLRGGRIQAVDAVNMPSEFLAVRKELSLRLDGSADRGSQAA